MWRPDMNRNSLSFERGTPGGAHVVGVGMRQDDAVETLLAVPAFAQSASHCPGAKSGIEQKPMNALVMSTQKQGGVATAGRA